MLCVHGTPCQEISETAKEIGVDLLIMATQGRIGLPHLLLRSVAEKVVRDAPCSVLTVRTLCQIQPSLERSSQCFVLS